MAGGIYTVAALSSTPPWPAFSGSIRRGGPLASRGQGDARARLNLPTAVVANYNAYVTSGVFTNTTAAAAYSTLTPFEVGTVDFSVLKSRALQSGATDRSANTGNNVACVSCHRVHASGLESMLRFFYLNEFSTLGDAAGVASYDSSTTELKFNFGFSSAMQQRAYYERPASMFGPYARKACNKCHAKD